jgi:hypothetical protein
MVATMSLTENLMLSYELMKTESFKWSIKRVKGNVI